MFVKLVKFETKNPNHDLKEYIFEVDCVEYEKIKVTTKKEVEKLISNHLHYTIIGNYPDFNKINSVNITHVFIYDRSKGGQKTIFAFDCDLYIMNNNGKTIDTI